MGISQMWNIIFKATSLKHEKRKNFLESKLKKLKTNTNYIENVECKTQFEILQKIRRPYMS